MSWQLRVTKYMENEAEKIVSAQYFDDVDPDTILHSEDLVAPSTMPPARILEELGRRGRSARLSLGKQQTRGPGNLVGQQFKIDDL